MSIQPFTYQPPASDEALRPKSSVRLCRSDLIRAGVQIVREGGENNLHSHPNSDGFWFVLAGQATFYDERDEIVAKLGPNEGVLVPRATPYWFESSGSVALEILHVSATSRADASTAVDRIDHRPRDRPGAARPA